MTSAGSDLAPHPTSAPTSGRLRRSIGSRVRTGRPTARLAVMGSVFALVTVVAAVPAGSAAAGTYDPQTLSFDWSQGTDAAIGVPGEDRRGGVDAGAVEIRYSNDSTAQVLLLPGGGNPGDRFGAAVAAGPIDGDEYADLAVGVPGLDVGDEDEAGGVALYRGSATGLHFDRLITQSSAGVPGTAQAGAHFGATLAFSFTVVGRKTVLRIGIPDRDVGSAVDAGAFVDLIVGSGVTDRTSRQFTLASPGLPGSPQAGDHLGAALYRNRMVGAPGRTVRGHVGAGAVLLTPTAGGIAQLINQYTVGVPGVSEAGDAFGSSLAFGWIGVPGESVGDQEAAGMIVHPDLDGTGSLAVSQDSPGVPGDARAGNRFGAAMDDLGAVVDEGLWSPRQLFVGAPGDDEAAAVDAGSVTMLGEEYDPDGVPLGLTGVNSRLLAADPTAGAAFGSAVARDNGQLLVGAPGAAGGSVTVFDSVGVNGSNPPTLGATWIQRAAVPESGDGFGSALAHGPN